MSGSDLAETITVAVSLFRFVLKMRVIAGARRLFRSEQPEVAYLVGLEGHPWVEWKNGKPLTKASLARLLNPSAYRCRLRAVARAARVHGCDCRGVG
jgi:hypothetical protein